MEEDLRRTAVELARSNADLEQFAYAASHDLQEPVRAVVMCLQLFQAAYTGRLDARADELIRHAVEDGVHMRTLIDTLLAYARVNTRGTPLTPTDCTIVLTQVLANFKVVLEESGAVVTHAPLPTGLADPTPLLPLFQNLLSNAIKLRTAAPSTVHIRAECQEDAWRCWLLPPPTVSQAGHAHDVPLQAMLPLLSKAQVGALFIALANPRHQHSYKVFKHYALPS
jgi:light-regulated signal transduction histidine kinase (bacteriophytochrome)